jgi:hypothetical protein
MINALKFMEVEFKEIMFSIVALWIEGEKVTR